MKKGTEFQCRLGLCHIIPISLLFLCPIALFVVGLVVANSYAQTRHFSDQVTLCTVRKVNRLGDQKCSCGSGFDEGVCKSSYPCVQIVVDYVNNQTGQHITNALLYDVPYHYALEKKDECSVYSCNEEEWQNREVVEDFAVKYGGIDQIIPCYPGQDVNPEALISVVEHWKVLLGMLLPAALLIVSATIELCYILNSRCQ